MSKTKQLSWSSAATFAILALFSFQTAVTSLKHSNMICDKLHDCVCGFPNGEGINLTFLGSEALMYNDSKNHLVFFFNPCSAALPNCSTGSALCMWNETNNVSTILGSTGGATFTSQGYEGPVFINYNEGSIETEIELQCWDKNFTYLRPNTLIDRNEPEDEVKYHLLLQSQGACIRPVNYVRSNPFSGAAVFFSVLLVLLCSYFIVGAAFNYLYRGAVGWEMIPHHDFWRQFPSKFMSGMRFVANGCKAPTSYEEI